MFEVYGIGLAPAFFIRELMMAAEAFRSPCMHGHYVVAVIGMRWDESVRLQCGRPRRSSKAMRYLYETVNDNARAMVSSCNHRANAVQPTNEHVRIS